MMPAGSPAPLPAEGASMMPAGDNLTCNLLSTPGQVDCTVAINLNIAPNGDPTTPASLLPGLHPTDLQSAYVLPSSRAGTTVAVIDAYDDPVAEDDLAVYRTAFGLPSCTTSNGCFQKVNQNGQTGSFPAVNQQWSQEISVDLDMVSAVCPNCKLLLVEANTPTITDLGTAIDTAVSLGAKAVSNSYYAQEFKGERNDDVYFKHSGVAITVSAGDQPYAYYPAASPFVTAVGGTSYSNSGGTRTEAPWGPGGQGCSVFEPKPAWQGTTGCSTRSTVDVSAVADPQTGVTMYDSTSGGWLVAGGTSVGAPIIAGVYALSGNPRGPAYSYGHTAGFFDLNTPGYDLPTGLGSPDATRGF